MKASVFDRLYSRCVWRGECLEWHGTHNQCGYGMMSVNGKNRTTHRIAWELSHGPIPKGLCVCHTCDNRRCVNPTHLFIGTKLDNNRDMATKGRAWNPGAMAKRMQTHCKYGHAYDQRNTYRRPNGLRYCRACRRVAA